MSESASDAGSLFLAIRIVGSIVDRVSEALGRLSPVAQLSEAERPEVEKIVLDGAELLRPMLPAVIGRFRLVAAEEGGATFGPLLSSLESIQNALESLLVTLGANRYGAQGVEPIDLALSFQRANDELKSRRDALFSDAAIRETLAEHGADDLRLRHREASAALGQIDGGQAISGVEPRTANPESRLAGPPRTATTAATSKKKAKRSTERGEARTKLIAGLTEHHKYEAGSSLNLEPIGVNALSRLAVVSPSTASDFFDREFNDGEKGGHARYRGICQDQGRLCDSLKALRGEFSPHELYGRRPPAEADRLDE